MGISGKPETLLDISKVQKDQIPVIKRFSGGGTVIVDENTLFITLIMNQTALEIPPFPEPILRWSFDFFQKAWNIPGFTLRENDYCIGDRKCAGNAQYIKKDRWLHHTSFLWDYSEENMQYLQLPERRPTYRLNRSHTDFLIRLKDLYRMNWTQEVLIEKLIRTYEFLPFDLNSLKKSTERQSTHHVDKLR